MNKLLNFQLLCLAIFIGILFGCAPTTRTIDKASQAHSDILNKTNIDEEQRKRNYKPRILSSTVKNGKSTPVDRTPITAKHSLIGMGSGALNPNNEVFIRGIHDYAFTTTELVEKHLGVISAEENSFDLNTAEGVLKTYIAGRFRYSKKEYENALTLYNRVIKAYPDFMAAWLSRAVLSHNINNLEQAITDYSKVISLYSKHYNAYLDRGSSYLKVNQLDKARTDFKLANNYFEKRILKSKHSSGYMLNAIGWRYAISPNTIPSDADIAIKYVEEAISRAPNNAHYLDTLASIYARKGDYDTAVVIAEDILESIEISNDMRNLIKLHLKEFKTGAPIVY